MTYISDLLEPNRLKFWGLSGRWAVVSFGLGKVCSRVFFGSLSRFVCFQAMLPRFAEVSGRLARYERLRRFATWALRTISLN